MVSVIIIALLLKSLLVKISSAKIVIRQDLVSVQETPTLTEIALSNSFYYVPVDLPGFKTQRFAEYMTTLADDSLKAADQLMKTQE